MATANDHFIAEERCRLRADHSSGEEIRRIWLNLAESYRLLALDEMQRFGAMIGAKRPQ